MDMKSTNQLDQLAELARNAGFAVKHDRRKTPSSSEILTGEPKKESAVDRLGQFIKNMRI